MSATVLNEITEDQLFTGNVEILGEINNPGLTKIITNLQKTTASLQTIKADLAAYLESIIADGIIGVSEKKVLLQKWEEIETEYPIVRQRGLDIGLAEDGIPITNYETAYVALDAYLNGTGGILLDMAIESTIDQTEARNAFYNYYTAREALISGVVDKVVIDTDEKITVVTEAIRAVHDGDLADNAIARAKLEAGFRAEHDSVLAEVYPFGSTAEPAFATLERKLFEVGSLTDILERDMLDRDEGMVLVDQRILLIAEDINGSLTRITSLEVTVGSINAIVSEFEGDHSRIGSLEIQADSIELSVADYDTEKAKIAQLQMDVNSINSILAELSVGGEIINLSLITQNANRIAGIVADGGYIEDGIFYPTKAYTQVGILKNRFDLFVAGDPLSGDVTGATWIVTPDQIEGFVVAADVSALIDGEVGPIDTRLSQVEQDADGISLTVQTLSGTVTRGDVDTADELLKILGDLQLQSESGIIITQNKIDISVQEQEAENILIWSRITLEAERITAEVVRAIAGETTLGSRITIEADKITSEVARASIAEEELEAYAEAQANLAEITAKAYADGIVSEEEQRAIADAQAKADAAAQTAITAAAIDATTKSAAAESAAKAYAEAQANLAEITAKAYADGIVSEEEQRAIADAQAKADAAALAAIGTAQGYTDSQISQTAEQISHRVLARAYDATTDTWSDTEAFMALRVALPEVISSERRTAIVALLSSAELIIFDRVYESFVAPWHEGLDTFEETRYKIASNPAPADITALTQIFESKGLLSSQFLVDADEVFMTGTIRGRHLEMESVSTEVFTAIKARIQELSAKQLKVDTDPASGTDFEVYIDENNGVLVKKNGTVIFSVNPGTGKVYLYGDADIEDGIFRGSIQSGPLTLNKNPPSTSSFTISGSVYNFLMTIKNSTGLFNGSFVCSGIYNGISLSKIVFSITETTPTYEYVEYVYLRSDQIELYPGFWIYRYWYNEYTWYRSPTRRDVSIKLYDNNNNEIASYADGYESSSVWGNRTLTQANVIFLSKINYPAPSPLTVPESGGSVVFGATGDLSFSATAFTFKLENLPAGYSSSYATGTAYLDENGFLKIKT